MRNIIKNHIKNLRIDALLVDNQISDGNNANLDDQHYHSQQKQNVIDKPDVITKNKIAKNMHDKLIEENNNYENFSYQSLKHQISNTTGMSIGLLIVIFSITSVGLVFIYYSFNKKKSKLKKHII